MTSLQNIAPELLSGNPTNNIFNEVTEETKAFVYLFIYYEQQRQAITETGMFSNDYVPRMNALMKSIANTTKDVMRSRCLEQDLFKFTYENYLEGWREFFNELKTYKELGERSRDMMFQGLEVPEL